MIKKFTLFYKTQRNITVSRNVQAELLAELKEIPFHEHVTKVPATN